MIIDKNYSIEYIDAGNKILFIGNLRLRSVNKYDEILDFILEIAYNTNEPLFLDLTKLGIINISGIAALGMACVKTRNIHKKIVIQASKYIPWQVDTLDDFKMINNEIDIEYVVRH